VNLVEKKQIYFLSCLNFFFLYDLKNLGGGNTRAGAIHE
jgi:hypothetical protein